MRLLVLALALPLALSGCAGLFDTSTDTEALAIRDPGDAAAAARLISQYRAQHGLSPVVADGELARAAAVQAGAVAKAGSLSHGNFAGRMAKLGIRGHAAENLSAGSPSVDGAVARWTASPGHNANLLMPQARRVGIARAEGSRYGQYWALVLAE
jgi:uncharacterized protein YkwD